MNLPKSYYPTGAIGANPIHPVMDWAKVRRLVRAVRRGVEVQPFLIDGSKGNCNLLTGTHRAAANNLLELLGDDSRIDWEELEYVKDAAIHEAAAESDYERLDELWDRIHDGS